MSAESGGRRGVPLHTKILLGLVLGAGAGVAANLLAGGAPWVETVNTYVAQPVGQIFLRMLFMVVVPLVFTTLALGVAGLGDLRSLGRIGGKTFAFFLFTTFLAVMLGLTAANVFQPGAGLDPTVREGLLAEYATQAADRVAASETTGFGISTFVNIVPRNFVGAAASGDMLGIIFFTLMFGVALTRLPKHVAYPVIRVLEGVAQAVIEIIGFAMKLAPYGVAGLIFSVTSQFGFDVLRSLGLYVVMVLTALAIHQFVVLTALARIFTGIGPRVFLRRCRYLMITAFSTSSSNATMPTTLRTAEEEFGVPREVSGFVVPLGATMNMNGTALFEGMTVLFLAQVFGVDLSLGMQAVVVVMSIVTAIGAAGVPSGSIPLLVMVLIMVGVPGEAIALVLGVDRILDMARTVPNVTTDLLTSVVVARSEGYVLVPSRAPDFSSAAAAEKAHLPGDVQPHGEPVSLVDMASPER
ncbi:MAG: dicarboxylate/amino acid:cation symporter [Gemmatimonadota bacterium]